MQIFEAINASNYKGLKMDIKLSNISHFYGNFEVIKNLSFNIETGKIICIVGPSGCGKSTLLRFIGGLERPTSGEVLQIGSPPKDSLNPMTFIFQDFALLPWRTVRGNISLVLEDHGIRGVKAQGIIDDVLARTKLNVFEHALPKQLSGGMKQRVAIARALAVNPAVMLLDEPLSALDSQTRELLIDDLVTLWSKKPFTAVYVTHNLEEAVRLGHSILVLSRRPGEIREVVTIDIPLTERTYGNAELEKQRKYLWEIMRNEARAADSELINV